MDLKLMTQINFIVDSIKQTDERKTAYNRVARPTQNYIGCASHTTVHADLAYGGLLSLC